ncbi:hypothetical protein [Paraburkholderia caribensis]|uniref:hypothetical protein n=1 Tax=Paraburkholderia caribensis TaxID=75105 RepID=UPI0034D28AF3
MFDFPEIAYQRQLIVASLDDFTPNATLSHVHGGQYGPNVQLWKNSVVNFLWINVRCGLLEGTHRKDISERKDSDFLKEILINGDPTIGLDAEILWNALYFNSTEKLDEMLDKFQLRDWGALGFETNQLFISELKVLYGSVG